MDFVCDVFMSLALNDTVMNGLLYVSIASFLARIGFIVFDR